MNILNFFYTLLTAFLLIGMSMAAFEDARIYKTKEDFHIGMLLIFLALIGILSLL